MKLRALNNKIICIKIEKGQQVSRGGIILMDDDAREEGIRPRWMQVHSVGPKVKDIEEGQWVMVEHGRWTHGMTMRDENNKDVTYWGAEEESVLLVSNERPEVERAASTAN